MVSAAIPLLLATAAIAGLQVASAAPVATDVLAKGTMECGGEPNESDLMTCTLNTNKKCADEEFGGPCWQKRSLTPDLCKPTTMVSAAFLLATALTWLPASAAPAAAGAPYPDYLQIYSDLECNGLHGQNRTAFSSCTRDLCADEVGWPGPCKIGNYCKCYLMIWYFTNKKKALY
ncbi:hypothetical protein PG996_007814 [Apiospora saccharicola]|uniref:Uncharacterized protein n=1 Tax=Apiospora saccharicola TaxID=335842 RepID=A0ABR1UW78_9PEZI